MVFFFFNDTATTEIYTLSLHDALPISLVRARMLPNLAVHDVLPAAAVVTAPAKRGVDDSRVSASRDRKSTRLNSSHANISYAVFCLKKKKFHPRQTRLVHRC